MNVVNKGTSSSRKCISKTCPAYCLPPCSFKEYAMKKDETEVKKEWYDDKKPFFIHQGSGPSRSEKTCYIRTLKDKKWQREY